MNPDHMTRSLAALPRFDSDPRRAERARARCHAALQGRPRTAAPAAPPIALMILQPLAIVGCIFFLVMMLGQAVRIVHLTPW